MANRLLVKITGRSSIFEVADSGANRRNSLAIIYRTLVQIL